MIVHGFQKTTLLDYPGHLAATIFLGKCNFRCPFCHNSILVLEADAVKTMDGEEILATLKKRKNILEGVCITGGEPTLNPELPDFIRAIKEIGLNVKLDTNGYKPDVVAALLEEGLLDYVAMDIKSSRENYALAAGVKNIDTNRIDDAIIIISNKAPDYEFRTTLVKGIHTEADVLGIGDWIKGEHKYFLQNYKDGETVINPIYQSFSDQEMHHFKDILIQKMPNVAIRGDYE